MLGRVVDIDQCRADVRVPHERLHIAERHSYRRKAGSERVTQVMEASDGKVILAGGNHYIARLRIPPPQPTCVKCSPFSVQKIKSLFRVCFSRLLSRSSTAPA